MKECLPEELVFSLELEGHPRWHSGKESTFNSGDTGSIPGSGKSPGEANGEPTQVFLPGKFRKKTMAGYRPWSVKLSILKSRDITLPAKVRIVKTVVFPVVMCGYESWTIKQAEH